MQKSGEERGKRRDKQNKRIRRKRNVARDGAGWCGGGGREALAGTDRELSVERERERERESARRGEARRAGIRRGRNFRIADRSTSKRRRRTREGSLESRSWNASPRDGDESVCGSDKGGCTMRTGDRTKGTMERETERASFWSV